MKQFLSSLVARYQAYRAKQREISELLAMDDRALADIAMTRGEVGAVARGEYIDPRPSVLAGRALVKAQQEAEQRALHRLAA